MLLERRRSRSGSSTTGGEFGRRSITKSTMGPMMVVVTSPILGQRLGRRHVLEHLGVEQLAPLSAEVGSGSIVVGLPPHLGLS